MDSLTRFLTKNWKTIALIIVVVWAGTYVYNLGESDSKSGLEPVPIPYG